VTDDAKVDPPPANEEPEAVGPQPPAAAPEPTGDALLDALWSRVMQAWDDEKPHHALLEYALREQRLPDVAGRYRAVKDTDPARAERAKKKLDGIVIAATQMLMAMKTPPPQRKVPAWITVLAAIVTASLLAYLTWGLVFHPHAR
jgi:hypothetical protein